MSVQDLCDELDRLGVTMNRPVLSNLENGVRHTVSAAEVFALARALEVPPSWLLAPVGAKESVEVLPGIEEDAWSAYRWTVGDLPNELLGQPRDPSVAYFRRDQFGDAIATYRSHQQAHEAYLRAGDDQSKEAPLTRLAADRIRMQESGWALPDISTSAEADLVRPLAAWGWRFDGSQLMKIAPSNEST